MKTPQDLLPDLEKYYNRAQDNRAVADLYQGLIKRLESDIRWINTIREKTND